MKKIIMAVSVIALAACSSESALRTAMETHGGTEQKYYVENTEMTISDACPSTGFMTEQELSDAFTKDIKAAFCETKTCTEDIKTKDVIVLIPKVNYRKVFMGEGIACNESYANNVMRYSFDLKKNGEIIHTEQTSDELVPGHGLISGYGRIFTQLSFSGGPDEEKTDVAKQTAGTAKRIVKDFDF